MIPLSAIGAGLSGIKTLFGLGTGITQLFKGSNMDVQRPIYNIDQETKDELGQAQTQLNSRLPGEQIITEQINQGQSNFLTNVREGATDSGQLLQSAGSSVVAKNNALKGLSLQFQDAFERRLNNLTAARRNMSRAKDREFQINKLDPFNEEANTKSALIEGGLQNISGALGEASGAIGKYQFFKDLQDSSDTTMSASKRAELFRQYQELQDQGFDKVLANLFR